MRELFCVFFISLLYFNSVSNAKLPNNVNYSAWLLEIVYPNKKNEKVVLSKDDRRSLTQVIWREFMYAIIRDTNASKKSVRSAEKWLDERSISRPK